MWLAMAGCLVLNRLVFNYKQYYSNSSATTVATSGLSGWAGERFDESMWGGDCLSYTPSNGPSIYFDNNLLKSVQIVTSR